MTQGVRGRDRFNKYKPIINLCVAFYSLFPKNLRKKLFEHHQMTKGIKGIAIRYILLKSIAKKIGDNVEIFTNVYILCPDRLSIGNNVSIHPMCYIDSTGDIEIGNDVSIAHGATILSTSHLHEDFKRPIKDQGVSTKKTVISNNVWVGAKTTILCGNVIGSGAILAANCVVTKSVEENSIYAGIPAKQIKKRG